MRHRCRAVTVAGPGSSVGKTTVALGLMAAFRRRGLVVQPFKCGPDFIDPGHHTRVCGRPCRNLDGWMISAETNRSIFATGSSGADIAIVEGVMGLFDGTRGSGEGSTAAMAASLGIPVILVVDASKMAASAAALVHGFETFDPATRIAGVIFNCVGGTGHYQLLREALEQAECAPALGYLPPDPLFRVPERHLGLYTAGEGVWSSARLDRLSSLVEECVDLDRVLRLAAETDGDESGPTIPAPSDRAIVRIAVARDRAFCFYYEDNLDALRAAGAEIVPFSPLGDRSLPEGADALYIGGGYPELYAGDLSANDSMRTSIARFADRGGPIYAECGGLMYLGRDLRCRDGHRCTMVGVLPFSFAMTDRLVRFGYADVAITKDCLIGRPGATARGHSFHYSEIESDTSNVDCAYHVRSTLSGTEHAEGYIVGNLLASYVHLHFLSNQEIASNVVAAARRAHTRAETV